MEGQSAGQGQVAEAWEQVGNQQLWVSRGAGMACRKTSSLAVVRSVGSNPQACQLVGQPVASPVGHAAALRHAPHFLVAAHVDPSPSAGFAALASLGLQRAATTGALLQGDLLAATGRFAAPGESLCTVVGPANGVLQGQLGLEASSELPCSQVVWVVWAGARKSLSAVAKTVWTAGPADGVLQERLLAATGQSLRWGLQAGPGCSKLPGLQAAAPAACLCPVALASREVAKLALVLQQVLGALGLLFPQVLWAAARAECQSGVAGPEGATGWSLRLWPEVTLELPCP